MKIRWPWQRSGWVRHPCPVPLKVPGYMIIGVGEKWQCYCGQRWEATSGLLYERHDGSKYWNLEWRRCVPHLLSEQVDEAIKEMEEAWGYEDE